MATPSIITKTAKGFLPSQSKGLVTNSTTCLNKLNCYGRMSNIITKKVRVRPLEEMFNAVKLIEYIFLLSGIKFVKGYTTIPNITDRIIHEIIVFFIFYLLSFIIRQNRYPK